MSLIFTRWQSWSNIFPMKRDELINSYQIYIILRMKTVRTDWAERWPIAIPFGNHPHWQVYNQLDGNSVRYTEVTSTHQTITIMKIIIHFCLFTFLNALPFWGDRKFNQLEKKPLTTAQICSFFYQVTTSNLPTEVRRRALLAVKSNKCFNGKTVQRQRNLKFKTFRAHHNFA